MNNEKQENTEARNEQIASDLESRKETARLRSSLETSLIYAESIGVMTSKEANQWRSGFDACEELSHMENLVEMVGDYISSGEEVLRELDDVLEHDLISDKERREWESEILGMEFERKREKLDYFKGVISELQELKEQFEETIDELPKGKRKGLREKFFDVPKKKKEKVLKKAEKMVKQEKPKPISQGRVERICQEKSPTEAKKAVRRAGNNAIEKLFLYNIVEQWRARLRVEQAAA